MNYGRLLFEGEPSNIKQYSHPSKFNVIHVRYIFVHIYIYIYICMKVFINCIQTTRKFMIKQIFTYIYIYINNCINKNTIFKNEKMHL